MGAFRVTREKEEALRKRMESLGIFEKDILEKFVRSSGKGGQKVNKTSTCVYLKHLPTKIEVKCQRERYQAINRYLARKILADKIEKKINGATIILRAPTKIVFPKRSRVFKIPNLTASSWIVLRNTPTTAPPMMPIKISK